MKILSPTLVAPAGMLISTHALPGPPPKPEISTSEAEPDIHKLFSSINSVKTTELNLAPAR
ncbi:hypothetical protein ACJ73_04755 [Blastomyces percursus]|uniref:Uncharacterized protein n=1 Tax=Blastomyces percursus TaxID=1658174 RepID=A0A1J9Q5A7_9EURO|nr:hypothetical protein ACJ73_04755 [Blastomyces percursus]